MTSDPDDLPLLAEALRVLGGGFASLPDFAPCTDRDAVRAALLEAAERLRDNAPYHHPLYVGQMLKPPHPVARLAYALAMSVNPNNHALDGGRASSRMEKEAVAGLAALVGWDTHLGHLSSGGTIANFEALWVGREAPARQGRRRVGPGPLHAPPAVGRARRPLRAGRRSMAAAGWMSRPWKRRCAPARSAPSSPRSARPPPARSIPLAEIVALRDRYDFRLHVDAAYGGYFALAANLRADARRRSTRIAERRLRRHRPAQARPAALRLRLRAVPRPGRRPVLSSTTRRTPTSARTNCTSAKSPSNARGPAASAVALWTTMRMLPLERGGAFAAAWRRAARRP